MAEGPPRLLVVAEAIVAETLPETLWRRHGLRAVGVTTADAALALARAGTLRVAMVELALADMDGLELSDKLRALQPSLKVVLLVPRGNGASGYPGVAAVIPKPYRLRQVHRVLKAVLDGGGARGAGGAGAPGHGRLR